MFCFWWSKHYARLVHAHVLVLVRKRVVVRSSCKKIYRYVNGEGFIDDMYT